MNSDTGAIGKFAHELAAAKAGYDVKLTEAEAEYLSTLPPAERLTWLSYQQNRDEPKGPALPKRSLFKRRAKVSR